MKDERTNRTALIMAGGVGTRFWPLSTRENPKQFLKLFNDRSLVQQSYDRVVGIVPAERILVLTQERFRGLVKEQLPEIPAENIIGEPLRRNTAAAVCLGALIAVRRFGNPAMITVTADHLIEPVESFRRAVISALNAAHSSGALYTFGVRPSFPSTEYGYLEIGARAEEDDGIVHYDLTAFKEKPDLETAQSYFRSGRWLWNSGMFAWTAETILLEIRRYLPVHLEHLSRAVEHEGTPSWPQALQEGFAPLEAVSIDYGIMEKAQRIRCVACGFHWKDMGGWPAIREYLAGDDHENRYLGRVYFAEAKGNLVFCEDKNETVVLIGMSDVVLVRAGSRTLLARKDRLEEIKHIVESMTEES